MLIDSSSYAERIVHSAHRNLYLKAGILHRDISVTSMLADYCDQAKGVIAGLDLAVQIDPDNHIAPGKPNVEIVPHGDPMFYSIDLGGLPAGAPPSALYYRHDLESFLYLLVYTICHLEHDEHVWAEGRRTDNSELLHLIFDNTRHSAKNASWNVLEGKTSNWRAHKHYGPPVDNDSATKVDNDSEDNIHARNEESIAAASRVVQALKTRFIELDEDAIQDQNDEGIVPETAAAAAPRAGDFFLEHWHDRTLINLFEAMPHDLGRQLVLPLQIMFREGYKARADWERRRRQRRQEMKQRSLEGARTSTGGPKPKPMTSVKGKETAATNTEEHFDHETLGGHVTFDKFIRIVEACKPVHNRVALTKTRIF